MTSQRQVFTCDVILLADRNLDVIDHENVVCYLLEALKLHDKHAKVVQNALRALAAIVEPSGARMSDDVVQLLGM